MNTLLQQLAGESLHESLAKLENRIRTQPGDADLRAAFAQLLCLDGNWPRAPGAVKSWAALEAAGSTDSDSAGAGDQW